MTAPLSTAMKAKSPLGRVQGELVYIEVEWLNILKELARQITAGAGSSFDPTSLINSIAVNAADISSLQSQVSALSIRVTNLEGGYER